MRYWEKILKEVLDRRDGTSTCFLTLPDYQENSYYRTEKNRAPYKSVSYFLGESFPGIYLTSREAQCMQNFLENKTVSEAASLLSLSPRTVEFYLKNMKTKLECKTKSELIQKVRESEFSKNYLADSKNENKN